jgi:hypothetical protein
MHYNPLGLAAAPTGLCENFRVKLGHVTTLKALRGFASIRVRVRVRVSCA